MTSISDIFVETSRWKEALARIERLYSKGWERNYCRALLMVGPSRSGKTTIMHRYCELMNEGRDHPIPRVLYVEVSKRCTPKLLVTEMLIRLQDARPGQGSIPEQTARICDAITRNGVEMIVFDEFQRLTDGHTGHVKEDVALWVTGLLNRRVCPLLIVGETTAEWVFEGSDYLKGRTMGEAEIRPYDWGDVTDRKEFRAFLHQVERQLALPEPSNLAAPDTALRVYAFSRGLVGEATRLLGDAFMLADERGLRCISHALLAETVDMLNIGSDRRKPNPFRLDDPEPGTPAAMIPITAPKKLTKPGRATVKVLA